MKIIVTGATGMVGAEVVREAIADNAIEKITAIVRNPLDITHPKLQVIIHENFLDYSSLDAVFKASDATIWCLGIAQSLVSKEQYQTITYQYAQSAGQAMKIANPEIIFMFLSGMGADTKEKSRTLFASVKGKTENALQKISFKKLYIIRPGGIRPTRKRKHGAWYEKLMQPFYPFLEFIFPAYIISSARLAKVMLYIIKNGSDKMVLENAALKQILKTIEK